MANTKQAKKRAEQSVRKRVRNRSVMTRVRTVVRKIRQTATTDADGAAKALPSTASELDIAVRKGVLHSKTASRLKSRVAKAVNKAGAGK